MFKKLNLTLKEFCFGVFLLLTPFLFYAYELVPQVKVITIFGVDFHSGYFSEWQVFFHFILTKLVPLLVLIILFFLSKSKVVYFTLPLIGLYIFQLYAIFLEQFKSGDVLIIDDIFLDRWFVFPIAVISGFILVLIRNAFNRKERAKKREELLLKEKMVSLKHQALNAQMNPHFINNLLLHIYVALENGNKKNSLSDLGNFSLLVSLILKSTQSDFISLEEELKIVDYYFKLQQSRFEHKFQYSIQNNNIEKSDLDLIKVPPMILQPIIENSIEHGIRSKDNDGVIEINLSEEKEYLYCEISDNGIGYSQSKTRQKKYHSGISLKNIEERLQIMENGVSDEKLVKIEDRINANHEIIGTKVILKVPLVV